jgi:hypothetical protein
MCFGRIAVHRSPLRVPARARQPGLAWSRSGRQAGAARRRRTVFRTTRWRNAARTLSAASPTTPPLVGSVALVPVNTLSPPFFLSRVALSCRVCGRAPSVRGEPLPTHHLRTAESLPSRCRVAGRWWRSGEQVADVGLVPAWEGPAQGDTQPQKRTWRSLVPAGRLSPQPAHRQAPVA